MLRATLLALAAAAVSSAFPPHQSPPSSGGPWSKTCISDSQAAQVGKDFGLLVSNYTDTLAEGILASTFADQTDSVITLIDSASQPQTPLTLGSVTFPSKAAFMALSSKQPPVPFQVINTWHTCDEVIIRWISKQSPQHVQGFTAMQVLPNTNRTTVLEYPFLINTTYGEFNSGAWLKNLGNPQCG